MPPLCALLKNNNLRHEWRLTKGDHNWPVRREYLTDFAPRLFQ
jgi:enterochelin esterase-like enzyme